MRYINNKTDMILKINALFDMLSGQIDFLKDIIGEALTRYEQKGDNEKQLIDAFFTLTELIERVVSTQQALKGNGYNADLMAFLNQTKEAFKRLDMAMTKKETNGKTQ